MTVADNIIRLTPETLEQKVGGVLDKLCDRPGEVTTFTARNAYGELWLSYWWFDSGRWFQQTQSPGVPVRRSAAKDREDAVGKLGQVLQSIQRVETEG